VGAAAGRVSQAGERALLTRARPLERRLHPMPRHAGAAAPRRHGLAGERARHRLRGVPRSRRAPRAPQSGPGAPVRAAPGPRRRPQHREPAPPRARSSVAGVRPVPRGHVLRRERARPPDRRRLELPPGRRPRGDAARPARRQGREPLLARRDDPRDGARVQRAPEDGVLREGGDVVLLLPLAPHDGARHARPTGVGGPSAQARHGRPGGLPLLPRGLRREGEAGGAHAPQGGLAGQRLLQLPHAVHHLRPAQGGPKPSDRQPLGGGQPGHWPPERVQPVPPRQAARLDCARPRSVVRDPGASARRRGPDDLRRRDVGVDR